MIYEYMVSDWCSAQSPCALANYLNYGSDGWELVAAFPAQDRTIRFIFKRPKASQPVGRAVDVTAIGSLSNATRNLR